MDIKKEVFYKEFIQRENNILRAPYDPEIEFYSAIASGDTQKVTNLCNQPLHEKKGLGTLADSPLQNLKYHFTITTALVARYCIQGGMELSAAYTLSDYYIQKVNQCTSLVEISDLHPVMCLDYAKRMKSLRKQKICSQPIVNCIDYIYDHLHTRITLDMLASHVNLSSSYLSRLFKKETGSTVSEYILSKKLETAKNMLLYSEYSPAQIASILAFPSQSYFTDVFHKKIGMTPLQYKASNHRNMFQ